MKTVHKSVLIWYSAAEMYNLVIDVGSYCEFLPWCDGTEVLSEDEHGMTAKIGLSTKKREKFMAYSLGFADLSAVPALPVSPSMATSFLCPASIGTICGASGAPGRTRCRH